MKQIWRDEHHKDGEQIYDTYAKALEVIKDILSGDEDLLRGRNIEDISNDDIFEYGHNFYGISMEEVPRTPCCDNEDLEFDMDGYTDGIDIETWKCCNCEKTFRVPIEIVRDFDNMEETKKPWSKFED